MGELLESTPLLSLSGDSVYADTQGNFSKLLLFGKKFRQDPQVTSKVDIGRTPPPCPQLFTLKGGAGARGGAVLGGAVLGRPAQGVAVWVGLVWVG